MKYIIMLGTLLAGAMMPVQAILNTRLGKQIGGPLMGAMMSFIVGLIFLFVLNLVINGQSVHQLRPTQHGPWYLWLGGILGAIFVGYITWVNNQQGVGLTFALAVSGQIFAALIVDHYGLLGTAVRPITLEKIIGSLLIIGGILLVKK